MLTIKTKKRFMNNKLRQRRGETQMNWTTQKNSFRKWRKRQKLKNTSVAFERPTNIKNLKHKCRRKIAVLSSPPPHLLTRSPTSDLPYRMLHIPLRRAQHRSCRQEMLCRPTSENNNKASHWIIRDVFVGSNVGAAVQFGIAWKHSARDVCHTLLDHLFQYQSVWGVKDDGWYVVMAILST